MIRRIKGKNISVLFISLVAVLVMLTVGMAFGGAAKATQKQKTFSSPEEAVTAAITAARNNDDKELVAIFGPAAEGLMFSRDAVDSDRVYNRDGIAYIEIVRAKRLEAVFVQHG